MNNILTSSLSKNKRIQKYQHIFEVSFENSKINLSIYLERLDSKWKIKKVEIFQKINNLVYILKIEFERNSNIYLISKLAKEKIFLDSEKSNENYILKPLYFTKDLNRPVKYFDKSFDYVPDPEKYVIVLCPLSTSFFKSQNKNKMSRQEHLVNIYHFYKNNETIKLLDYIIEHGIKDEIDLILPLLWTIDLDQSAQK